MKYLFILISFSFLSACGTLGEKFTTIETPEKDEAIIYYYRPPKFFGGGVFYDIKNNENVVTTLYNGGYFPQKIAKGKQHIEAKTESTSSVDIFAENGKVYFVRGGVGFGFFIGRPELHVIPEEQALMEIKDCRLLINEEESP